MHKLNSIFNKFIFLLVLFAVTSCSATTAFALNDDYLSYSKYKHNDNINTESFSFSNGPYGTVEYFSDNKSLSLYTRFSFREENSKNDMKNTKIIYKVYAGGEKYEFSVGENGIEEMKPNAKGLFEARSNYSNASIGDVITAVQYMGRETSCNFTVALYTNKRYTVIKSLNLELPTTQKAVKTTAPKTAKQPKATTKKQSKATTSGTTKFKPKYKANIKDSFPKGKSSTDGKDEKDSTRYETTGITESSQTQLFEQRSISGKAERSNSSKALLIAGIVLAILGIIAIIVAKFIKDNNNSSDNREEEDNE